MLHFGIQNIKKQSKMFGKINPIISKIFRQDYTFLQAKILFLFNLFLRYVFVLPFRPKVQENRKKQFHLSQGCYTESLFWKVF